MPRKRMIDPEYWSDEEISHWSAEARLFYIGLWNFADDEGRLQAHPSLLRSQIFPYDAKIDIEKLMKEVSGKVEWYQVDGQRYGFVKNFKKHQTISHPYPSKIPKFTERSSNVPVTFHPNIIQSNIIQSNISEVSGAMDPEERSGNAPAILKGLDLYERDPKLCGKIQKALPAWVIAYPGVNVPDAIKRAHAWEVSNPKRRKIDRIKFLQSWLAREQDKYRPPESGSAGTRPAKVSPNHPRSGPGKYSHLGKGDKHGNEDPVKVV